MSPISGPPGVGSPVRINKLGFLTMSTPDVDRLTEYYVDALELVVVDRDAEAAYLTTGPEHHALAITKGEAHGRAAVGLEIVGSLDDAATALQAAGVDAERRGDPQPGIADALVIEERLTGTPLFLYERQAPSGVATSLGLRPHKLGHVASYVPELLGVQGFWEGTLGFRWSDLIGDFFVFMRCNADHHSINLMASSKFSGLHHVAFELRNFIHTKDMLDHLARRDVRLEWGPGRHGAGHNVFTYHKDPDGNLVELFCELDVVHDEVAGTWEPRPWHEEFPQGPKVWALGVATANTWGPINPTMLDH
jgi:catechol-2,3-dioxygenase